MIWTRRAQYLKLQNFMRSTKILDILVSLQKVEILHSISFRSSCVSCRWSLFHFAYAHANFLLSLPRHHLPLTEPLSWKTRSKSPTTIRYFFDAIKNVYNFSNSKARNKTKKSRRCQRRLRRTRTMLNLFSLQKGMRRNDENSCDCMCCRGRHRSLSFFSFRFSVDCSFFLLVFFFGSRARTLWTGNKPFGADSSRNKTVRNIMRNAIDYSINIKYRNRRVTRRRWRQSHKARFITWKSSSRKFEQE